MGGHAADAMVGRDRELARVTGLLDDTLDGRGRLVLCTGEAGIGKTRLAEELATAAAARGVAVAACQAAAEVAAESLAFEEAVRLYRQALSAGEGGIGSGWPALRW